MEKKNFWQMLAKVIVAALTAITTTSCMGYGPM